MLPEPEDMPTQLAKLGIYPPVPCLIPQHLRPPEGGVSGWRLVAPRAAVPKAAVNKDGDLPLAKDEVGGTWKPLVSSPSAESMAAQQLGQSYLCCFVSSAPYGGHDAGPCRGHFSVRHGSDEAGDCSGPAYLYWPAWWEATLVDKRLLSTQSGRPRASVKCAGREGMTDA
jgi:hypothetical protein